LWEIRPTPDCNLEVAGADLAEAVELVLEANRILAEGGLRGRKVIREPFSITVRR
jgi:hypothetical protein